MENWPLASVSRLKGRPLIGQARGQLRLTWRSYAGPPQLSPFGAYGTTFPPQKRWDNKAPVNIHFKKFLDSKHGLLCPACGGKMVASATKGGMLFQRPQGRLYGFTSTPAHQHTSQLNLFYPNWRRSRPPPPFEPSAPSDPSEPSRQKRVPMSYPRKKSGYAPLFLLLPSVSRSGAVVIVTVALPAAAAAVASPAVVSVTGVLAHGLS